MVVGGDGVSGVAEGEAEVRQDPAVGGLVVQDDRIAVRRSRAWGVIGIAPECALSEGGEASAGRFVVDGVGAVDGLDVVVESHIAVHVGWIAAAALSAGAEVFEREAVEVDRGCRRGGVQSLRGSLKLSGFCGFCSQLFRGRSGLEAWRLGKFESCRHLLYRDLRQCADIAVEVRRNGRLDVD